jgi:FMN phosphatase YigB (HAD superfamily)
MSVNLLLDLDGTLLTNSMETFLPAYLKALAKHLADHADPEQMISSLMAGTQQMNNNRRPDRTLKDAFDGTFYPALGWTEAGMRDTLLAFYQKVFPGFKELTTFRPAAVELVQEAQRRGYKIGIATNPLFPRIAIDQRLAWAGLSPDTSGIEYISSYENFHFAKPEPAYLAEFLAKMGWPEGPVVYVGNDPQLDIEPAHKMGLKTFYVQEERGPAPGSTPDLSPGGKLADFLPWLDSQDSASLVPDYSSPTALLATLRATPAVLHSLGRDLPESMWTLCTIPGEWCLSEITCHLRDVDAEVNIPRFQKMLLEENPFLPGFDTDSWVSERQYIAQDCLEALSDFIKNRLHLLEILESLQPLDWQRKARHAIFGPTRLSEIVSILAGHDRLHLQQIHKTIR